MTSHSSRVRRARPLLGTYVEIEATAADELAAHAAVDAGFRAVEAVQRAMNFHDPESTLSRVNREAVHRPVPVDAATYAVLSEAAELHRATGGVFDVTTEARPRHEASATPPPARFAGLPGRSFTFSQVELSAGRCVRFHHPGMRIDLGGIAKGFAVDEAVRALRTAGARAGLVNAGGDLRAFGDAPWPVTIRKPDKPAECLTRLMISNGAVATSAHYFDEEVRSEAAHREASKLPRSVTVRASRALLADALTKVVMLDPECAPLALTRFQASALVVAHDGEIRCSVDWDEAFDLST